MKFIRKLFNRINKTYETQDVKGSIPTVGNRYADDWNAYSKSWEHRYGSDYTHLGDEWNDDGTQKRERDQFYFRAFAERFITKEMTVLEIGPDKLHQMLDPIISDVHEESDFNKRMVYAEKIRSIWRGM